MRSRTTKGAELRAASFRLINTDGFAKAFWGRVTKDGPIPEDDPSLGPCWLFDGRDDPRKYSTVYVGGQMFGAHRVAWALSHGSIAEELVIRHRCDFRPCVNSERHLVPGTISENTMDMVARGRHGRGRAKLSDKEALEIISAPPKVLNVDLAMRFQLSPAAVGAIRARKTYKHL